MRSKSGKPSGHFALRKGFWRFDAKLAKPPRNLLVASPACSAIWWGGMEIENYRPGCFSSDRRNSMASSFATLGLS